MSLDIIVEMEFGSCVYGTKVPSSDIDYKAIYLPEQRDLLLGRAKEAISFNTKQHPDKKNELNDVDREIYSLNKYVNLLLEGQTVALDMLFVGKQHIIFPSNNMFGHWSNYYDAPYIWETIQENRKKFLFSGYASYVGYCRTQSNKYGIKGSRVAAIRKVLEFLNQYDIHSRLSHYDNIIQHTVNFWNDEFISIQMLPDSTKTTVEPYLECCGRKVPFHATFKYAIDVFQKIFDEYGKRALLAERSEGVDWKALMHAVRITNQAQELLLTHNITFPRPEKELLLQIRKGELPYKQVAEMIEEGLINIESAATKSTLPKEPNRQFAEDLVYYAYQEKVKNS